MHNETDHNSDSSQCIMAFMHPQFNTQYTLPADFQMVKNIYKSCHIAIPEQFTQFCWVALIAYIASAVSG